jgi:hypothetical protein
MVNFTLRPLRLRRPVTIRKWSSYSRSPRPFAWTAFVLAWTANGSRKPYPIGREVSNGHILLPHH